MSVFHSISLLQYK